MEDHLNQLEHREHREIQHLYALHQIFVSYVFPPAISENLRAPRLGRKIHSSYLRIILFNAVGYISVTKPCQTIHLFHNILL